MLKAIFSIKRFFKGADEHDEDFGARMTQLTSDLTLCQRERNPKLAEDLSAILGRLSPQKVQRGDIDQLHRVEAELCLLVPTELLRPTWWRLREKLYRLETKERDSWEEDMTRLLPEGNAGLAKEAEDTVRQRLRRLVFDLYTAGTNFTRISAERARVIRSLTLIAATWVVCGAALAVGFYWFFGTNEWDGSIDLRLLPSASFAGVIGGAISALRGLTRERARDELLAVLQWQLTLRCLVAGVSAGFVYLTVSSGLVTFNVPAGGRPGFYLALGFVSGFSERVFAQTVSAFVVKRDQGDGKSRTKKKNDNR